MNNEKPMSPNMPAAPADAVGVAIVSILLNALKDLGRCALARAQSAAAGGAPTAAPATVPPLRLVIDERADVVALAILDEDGRQLQQVGWQIGKVRALMQDVEALRLAELLPPQALQ
ncbi:MAG: hypothetical protein IT182_03830 [Acidobacteria bacterium]|nr:hypothetical protein [Acidobacteriota bacterium]